VKPAADTLRHYEYAFRQPDFVRPAVKYDNRAIAVRSLRSWAIARKPVEKVHAPDVEVPINPAAELLAQGYKAALEA
jgi:hypothetical protein